MFWRRGVKFALILTYAAFSGLFCFGLLQAEETNQEARPDAQVKYAGRFFDIDVPAENYAFVKAGLVIFGNKFGPAPQSPEEEEGCIWEQLLLSYEAHRRGIVVNQDEIDSQVQEALAADKVSFDWKKDREAYEKWINEKTNAASVLFENLIRHNLQIQKLRQQVMESISVTVSRQDARREFLNEHNTLSLELVEFAEKKDADGFYRKAKANQLFWDEQKAGRPEDFRRPGFVSLEFLIDIWRLPRDDLYRMMKMKAGAVYPPVPIYKGYGVCKILEIRQAVAAEFKRFKEYYYDQIRQRKKYEGLGEWIEGLKRQANIKKIP